MGFYRPELGLPPITAQQRTARRLKGGRVRRVILKGLSI
jgi:hypothetical protein